jgi:hypothetical protein
LLLLLALIESGNETVLGLNGLAFGTLIIVAGFVVYLTTKKLRPEIQPVIIEDAEAA